MNHSNFKTAFVRAGLPLLAALSLLVPAVVRGDVTVSVDKGQSTSQRKADPATTGGSKNGSINDGVSGSIIYTLTVRNLSDGPVKGVTVEYHFFNKTTSTSSGNPATITLDDITSTSTIDLDGNGVKAIPTSAIPKSTTNNSTPSSYNKKTGVTTPGTYSSINTSVLGWVVYVKKGDKVVHRYTSSDTVLDEVAKINKKNNS